MRINAQLEYVEEIKIYRTSFSPYKIHNIYSRKLYGKQTILYSIETMSLSL